MEVSPVRRMQIIDRTEKPVGELRCPECNKLLSKEASRGSYAMEFKCPRCGGIHVFMRGKNRIN